MILRAFILGLACLMNLPARADNCDALTARLIRSTGASFAGRSGALVVFRAEDAERMSLVCGSPKTMLFRSLQREPNRPYFILIGLAAQALAGARAEAVEALALGLHRESLLTGEARQGRAGPIAVRCDPTDRADGFHAGALCRIAPAAGIGSRRALRRRAGLSAAGRAG